MQAYSWIGVHIWQAGMESLGHGFMANKSSIEEWLWSKNKVWRYELYLAQSERSGDLSAFASAPFPSTAQSLCDRASWIERQWK